MRPPRPAREWAGLYRLNEQIIGAQTDPYGIALAIEQFLRSRYDYSLEPPSVGFASPYAAFLFRTKTGYCQHFAGAMACSLRFNGVPARVAVGFTGRRGAGEGRVRRDAQRRPRLGRGVLPGGRLGAVRAHSGPAHPRTPAMHLRRSVMPRLAAGLGAAGARRRRRPRPAPAAEARTADPRRRLSGRRRASGGPPAGSPWSIALVVALVGWPAGRALLRRRGLRRRHPGGAPQLVRLRCCTRTCRTHGVDVPPSQTLEETAGYLDERLDVDAGSILDPRPGGRVRGAGGYRRRPGRGGRPAPPAAPAAARTRGMEDGGARAVRGPAGGPA